MAGMEGKFIQITFHCSVNEMCFEVYLQCDMKKHRGNYSIRGIERMNLVKLHILAVSS